MKKVLLMLAITGLSTGLFAQKDNAKSVELKTALDSVNYGYGITTGNTIKRILDKDINLSLFLAGLNAAVNGSETKLTNEEANRRYSDYNTKTAQPRINARWKEENTKFLEENKKRKEVTTTASGLQYEVMQKGTGTVSPTATDKVEVHYHGTMIDGQIFDSSVQRNKTSSFGLNQVIPGWTEGLQYMKVGDKFKFFIPYNLAYGENARGSIIKGFSTLIFEVELFKINP
jgi:FKBP-type peptidyl-prolyl cis-trans isomerase FklB